MNQNKKIKLFILTAYYPPILSVASQRLHAIAKYIDKTLYDVYIFVPYEQNIESDIDNVTIINIPNKSLLRYAKFDKNTSYLLHKLKALWNRILINLGISHFQNIEKGILKAIEKYISNEPFVVLTSSPPIEILRVGLSLKQKYSNCRWIVDLRDALSNNPYIPVNQVYKHKKIEEEILQHSDAIASVSMPIVTVLESKNTRQIPIMEIRNGFDFEAKLRFQFNEQFTIVHAGTFYANRTPETFFKALENLINKKILDDFKLIFVGQSSAIKIPNTLKPYIHKIEKVEYYEAVKIIQLADALLLIHPPSEYKGVFTAKLFDYLGAMKPIIAVVDKQDVAAQLIHECNAGFVADFYTINEIEQAITSAFNLWKNKKTLTYNVSLINIHHRAYQVKLFEHLISKVLYES